MITTYGIGAMLAVGEQSYVVSGLDSWPAGEYDVFEPRLQDRLRVEGFRSPPAADPPAGDGVRMRLFPRWYSCPDCLALQPHRDFNPPPRKNECGACARSLVPSRFVIACENGHLDDFPYWEWVHHGKGKRGDRGATEHRLTLRSTGRTASLQSVVVACSCGEEASLEGAFGRSAMAAIGVRCSGARPWLGEAATQRGCALTPRTLQRGSSAAWFPVMRSALSIPPYSDGLWALLAPHYKTWLRGKTPAELRRNIENILSQAKSDHPVEDAIALVEGRRRQEEAGGTEPVDDLVLSGFESADPLRRDEYRQLEHGADDEGRDHGFVCVPPSGGDGPPPGIGKTMLVKRLREVRALQSFTRVDMPMPTDVTARRARLAAADLRWLPAIEVVGEGVFLRLDHSRLTAWERDLAVMRDVESVRAHHTAQLKRRAADSADVPESPLTARYMLVHTLAHALINEWSLDAGYPAASLRERLYASDDMAGILIYTATSDSAGSLGGLVAQGAPDRMAAGLQSALERVSWCSADPLCMESEAAGVDSLNLAACHACVLLPETSCEAGNSFLDRALLVGSVERGVPGYFEFQGHRR
ncbi:DrmB family protein [Yinghuangia seranimata]|uniref:DrmB family protein n=1 Tax=Yinghuangia seranimata TaxID=408067 RepID=UPI003CCF528D